MKKIILILLLSTSICTAKKKQDLRFEAGLGISYCDNNYKLSQEIFSLGETFTRVQLRGYYKRFELRFDNLITNKKSRSFLFSPKVAFFNSSIRFNYKKVTIYAEHQCVHPLLSDGKNTVKLYGGYNKIGINFNIK